MRTVFAIGFILGLLTSSVLVYTIDCELKISKNKALPNASTYVYNLRCEG